MAVVTVAGKAEHNESGTLLLTGGQSLMASGTR